MNLGKSIFKNAKGEIHFGISAPQGFAEGTIEDAKKALKNAKGKKFWRCHVCSDLHFAPAPPEICPTCSEIEAYCEINEKEFLGVMGI